MDGSSSLAQAAVILASASPRRRRLFGTIGISYESVDMAIDERPLAGESPADLARRLATTKAQAGACQFPGRLVLGADTVVALDNTSLGKPVDATEARDTLRRLRNRQHHVITGVAAAFWSDSPPERSPTVWARTATTSVWMRAYTDQEIDDYIASGDPFDKAGSYAIQDVRFHPVARLEGCFLNVVGLPLPETRAVLQLAGVDLSTVPLSALHRACPDCIDTPLLTSRRAEFDPDRAHGT